MNTSSSTQIVPYLKAKAIKPAMPAAKRPPAAQAVVVFSVIRLEAGGRVTTPTQSFAWEDAIVNVELAPGVMGNRAPRKDLVLTETANGRMTAFRYVKKQKRWFKSTSAVLQLLGSLPSPVRERGWLWRFLRNLWRRLFARNVWTSLKEHPYQQFFALRSSGRVELASGGELNPGDSPVTLATGETLARNGLDVTLHAENGEVVERWRRESHGSEWRRLVTLRPIKLSEIDLPAELTPDGALTFHPEGALPFTLKADCPFTLYLDGTRKLVRPSQGSQVFIFDAHGTKVSELFIAGDLACELAGAKDDWIYTMVGCPGGIERPQRSVEVMPGAITLMDTGAVLILGRFYLPGEPLDIRNGAIRVERAPGIWSPLYVRTATSVIGYLFTQDSEWWQLSSRVADSKFYSAQRYGAVSNYVTFSFHWVEAFIADAPGVARIDSLLFALARTAEGFGSQPLLLHLGIFMAMFLGMSVLAGYWATRLVAVPWAAIWRAYRHVRRAVELT